jgi:hypothetical protein
MLNREIIDMLDREIIEVWADYDPVEAYASGMDTRPRKLYVPSAEKIQFTLRVAEAAREKLGRIEDDELRESAAKILDAISVDVRYPRPDVQVAACAALLLSVLLKEDERKDFVPDFLRDAAGLIAFENQRLAGGSLNAEARKLCLNSADFLDATLSILEKRVASLASDVAGVRAQMEKYRGMFGGDGLDAQEFNTLFAALEKLNAEPRATPGYEEMLKDLYDYGMTSGEIRSRALTLLDEELRLVRELAPRLAEYLRTQEGSRLGEIYTAMGQHFAVQGKLLDTAERMMHAINDYTEFFIQDIDNKAFIKPEAAPPHLTDLITSGATVVLNYLTCEPIVKVYLTEEKNKSVLTMLNVLAHEGTHAYRGLLASKAKMPPLLKRRTYLSIPLNEGMAFHREFEFYEAARGALQTGHALDEGLAPKVVSDFFDLFGASAEEREFGVAAFEMETRVWRVMRFVRAVCDVEVNTGKKSYVEFVNWANDLTELGKEFIHSECFPFLSNPGYMPSYAICGVIYAELQVERLKAGVPLKSFNTQASRIGFFPWSICKAKLGAFGPLAVRAPHIPSGG